MLHSSQTDSHSGDPALRQQVNQPVFQSKAGAESHKKAEERGTNVTMAME